MRDKFLWRHEQRNIVLSTINTVIDDKKKTEEHFNPEKYVLIVPLNVFECILDIFFSGKPKEIYTEVYHNGVRIMWHTTLDIILVTKEVYNQKYNPSSSIKLI